MAFKMFTGKIPIDELFRGQFYELEKADDAHMTEHEIHCERSTRLSAIEFSGERKVWPVLPGRNKRWFLKLKKRLKY